MSDSQLWLLTENNRAARVSGMRIRLDQVKVTQQVSGVLAGLTEQLQKDESVYEIFQSLCMTKMVD